MRGHHLLERGAAAAELGELALQRLDVARDRLGPHARRLGARARRVAPAGELGRLRLRHAAARVRRLARGGRGGALALELRRLARELREVRLRALGVARHRRLRVLERSDPAQERHLRLAAALLPLLGGRERRRRVADRLLGGAELGLGRKERFLQPGFLGALGGERLLKRRDPRHELLLLAHGLLRAHVGLADLLLAVAAAPLVAVDRQRQLREPRARALECRLAVVERLAQHLELRLLGLEGDARGALALRLRRVARLERARALHEVEEAPAEQHALAALHLFLDLAPAPGLRGLALQALELLLDLADDVVHAQQVLLRRLELELGLAPAGPVLRDPGRLLDDRAPVGGLAGEDLSDLALLDDRVRLRAEPRVHEQLVDVAQAADLAVHQVLALAVAVQAARDDALGRSVGAVAVEAGDLEADLGHLQRLAARRAVEDHVLHRRAAQALDALLAEHPVDRVRDVALAAAVRAHDPGHAAREGELLAVAEALEADDLNRIQTH